MLTYLGHTKYFMLLLYQIIFSNGMFQFYQRIKLNVLNKWRTFCGVKNRTIWKQNIEAVISIWGNLNNIIYKKLLKFLLYFSRTWSRKIIKRWQIFPLTFHLLMLLEKILSFLILQIKGHRNLYTIPVRCQHVECLNPQHFECRKLCYFTSHFSSCL